MLPRDYAVLLVDPDAHVRALLAEQLSSTGCTVIQASDGEMALDIVNLRDIRLVVTELYLKAGEDDCLIHAIRRSKSLRKTRTMALTDKSTAADRNWAMRAGADAYLIKPTRAERFRYVVSRLVTTRGANSSVPVTTESPIVRRDSLDAALSDLESGNLADKTSIVFSRGWWEQLGKPQQTKYCKRAKRAGVSLKSDSVLSMHFVEVRGTPIGKSLSTERRESPYRE
jgi:DNA-binding response OmpR family regulator